MGWITLSCRSKEDLSCKANYQFRLLQVSREQRQKAREYQFMQTQTQNNQQENVRNIRSNYDATIEANRDSLATARKLLSIQNIRGKLMDCTSENDFIIKSYILKKFPELNDEQKKRVVAVINEYMKGI